MFDMWENVVIDFGFCWTKCTANIMQDHHEIAFNPKLLQTKYARFDHLQVLLYYGGRKMYKW